MKGNTDNQLHPYKMDLIAKISNKIKIFVLKWWTPGAIYFFIGWGLAASMNGTIDVIVVLAITLGLLTNYFTNPVIRMMGNSHSNTERYLFITKKGIKYDLFNILYNFVLVSLIILTYSGLNILINNIKGVKDVVSLTAEPILFGLLYLLFDLIFIAIKHVFKKIN